MYLLVRPIVVNMHRHVIISQSEIQTSIVTYTVLAKNSPAETHPGLSLFMKKVRVIVKLEAKRVIVVISYVTYHNQI